jgi:hypothetical protein
VSAEITCAKCAQVMILAKAKKENLFLFDETLLSGDDLNNQGSS